VKKRIKRIGREERVGVWKVVVQTMNDLMIPLP